jgi:hypothetical protein
MAGEKSGITGMEFPLMNYLIYLVSLLFGFDHWYGRLINLIVSSLGIWYFYRIAARYFDKPLAFHATLILLSSIWFNYSRKIMPDTFSMALVIMGLSYGLDYLARGKTYRVLLAGILVLAGILSKLPSAFLVTVLVLPLVSRHNPLTRRAVLVVVLLVAAVITGVWYFYWVPHLVETFGYWHFYMGTSWSQGLREILNHPGDTASKFYFSALYSYAGFLAFLGGAVLIFVKRERVLPFLFGITTLGFLAFMIKAGFNFPHHNYYIIPYVPVMALLAGYLVNRIRLRWFRVLLLTAIMMEGIANQQHDFRIREDNRYILSLETVADQVSVRSDLIMINGGINPVDLYYTHRKGWTKENNEIFDGNALEESIPLGCRYLFLNIKKLPENSPALPFSQVYEDPWFRVYDLREVDPAQKVERMALTGSSRAAE